MTGLRDKYLEEKLWKHINKLGRHIDCIGPTPLRHELDEYRCKMANALRSFDQLEYEDALDKELEELEND